MQIPSTHTVDANGTTISYSEQGTGPVLILIHGGLSSGASLLGIAAALAGDFRVITPDSRGHGNSTNPADTLSYPLLADDMAAFITALDLDRPIVGGWSDGGQVALELGIRHPAAARGLILGATAPDMREPRLAAANRALLAIGDDDMPDIARLEASFGEFLPMLKSMHGGGDEQWRKLIADSAEMYLGYPGRTDEELARLAVPTLVLVADRDEFVPLDISLALFRALPEAELAVLPGMGHDGPFLDDRTALFTAPIRDFAQRQWAR